MKQVELSISQVSAIAHKTGILFGEIVATTSSGVECLDMVKNEDAIRMAAVLSELVFKQGKRAS